MAQAPEVSCHPWRFSVSNSSCNPSTSLDGSTFKTDPLGETCSRRARKSPRCQHDISKWYVLTAHLNGKASKQDPCFSLNQESKQRIYSPLKTLRNETFIFILTVKVTFIAFSATNVLTQKNHIYGLLCINLEYNFSYQRFKVGQRS